MMRIRWYANGNGHTNKKTSMDGELRRPGPSQSTSNSNVAGVEWVIVGRTGSLVSISGQHQWRESLVTEWWNSVVPWLVSLDRPSLEILPWTAGVPMRLIWNALKCTPVDACEYGHCCGLVQWTNITRRLTDDSITETSDWPELSSAKGSAHPPKGSWWIWTRPFDAIGRERGTGTMIGNVIVSMEASSAFVLWIKSRNNGFCWGRGLKRRRRRRTSHYIHFLYEPTTTTMRIWG